MLKVPLARKLLYILKKEGPLPTEKIVELSGESRRTVRSCLCHLVMDGKIKTSKCKCCGVGTIYEVIK